MLDLSSLDLDEIATALADQADYDHRWLINPATGEVLFWTFDTGIDGQTPVDLDEPTVISRSCGESEHCERSMSVAGDPSCGFGDVGAAEQA